jgi:putative membrane protein
MGPGGQPWGWMPWGAMWIFPLVMMVVVILWIFLLLGREGCKPPWWQPGGPAGGGSESAQDILKKRYARGEITKDEFDRMKKDID